MLGSIFYKLTNIIPVCRVYSWLDFEESIMKTFIGILTFVCLVWSAVNADPTTKSESDLRRALFENYDKLVRPVRSTTDTIPVRIDLSPVAIKDVDVDDRVVKLDAWLFMKWQDSYLIWDPSEYGGLQHLRLPASEVWIPDIALYYGTSDEAIFPRVRTNVVIFSNGTVLWVPPFSVKSRCPLTDNPVTEGTFQCTITLGSWTYDVTLLDLQERVVDVLENAREHFLDVNEKWTLESATASTEQKIYSCCEEAYPAVHYNMLFRKRHHLTS